LVPQSPTLATYTCWLTAALQCPVTRQLDSGGVLDDGLVRAGRVRARLYLLLKKKTSGQERTTRIHSRNPERTWIVRVHQKSQDQPGAKVEPSRRTTTPDRRAQAVFCRRRHQPRRPPPAKIRPGRPAPTMGRRSIRAGLLADGLSTKAKAEGGKSVTCSAQPTPTS
jgi:hypothetical protein